MIIPFVAINYCAVFVAAVLIMPHIPCLNRTARARPGERFRPALTKRFPYLWRDNARQFGYTHDENGLPLP